MIYKNNSGGLEMRVVCSKDNLMEGINITQKAVSSKTTLPILEGILLEASDKFKLTGNDLEIGIECIVESDIQRTGSIVLNSRMFGDIVRRLPESEVLIEVKDNNLVIIECENSHFELKGINASGFPVIPEINKNNTFTISQKLLKDMIKQTLFAVSTDENRPILNGSLIECKDNTLSFVSIDGYRMALRSAASDNENQDFSVVVPGKTLNEIGKILQPVDDEITIYNSENQITFDMGNCRVVSRLIEGEYLNYRNLIPKDFETKIKVRTKELLSSVERASLITMDEKRYSVKFSIDDEKIIISLNTDMGAVREEIRIDMTGSKMNISFNPRYFIDALKVIDDEEIEVKFTSNVGPCILAPVDGDSYTYMILPVRTRDN